MSGFPVDGSACRVPSPFPVHFRCGARPRMAGWTDHVPDRKCGSVREHGRPVIPFVSRDPRFELRVRDVVGLYVNPPDHAVVLSVDEKPRRQALGGTAPPAFWRPSTSPRGRSWVGRSSGTLGGVPLLLRPRRGGDRARNPGARHSRQRVVPPLGRGPRVAEGPSRLDVSLHADLGVLDERRRGVLPEAGAAEAEERGLRLSGRLRRGDRGLHRAPQRQGRPPVSLEPRPGGSRGVLEAGSPEASGNGISCFKSYTSHGTQESLNTPYRSHAPSNLQPCRPKLPELPDDTSWCQAQLRASALLQAVSKRCRPPGLSGESDLSSLQVPCPKPHAASAQMDACAMRFSLQVQRKP